MKVLNILPFCLFRKGTDREELGVANGYFAGTAWAESEERFETITGSKFGWLDSKGMHWSNDKGDFSRPTEEEIKNHLYKAPFFLAWCIEEGLISYDK